jgi:hypothetical protein
MTTHLLTLPFSPKTTQLPSPTLPTFLFTRLKLKLKGHHFDTTEVIKAESQAVLNTPTAHDFAFKSGRSSGNGLYTWKGTTSRVMVASGPKLVFDQIALCDASEEVVLKKKTESKLGIFCCLNTRMQVNSRHKHNIQII